MQNLTKFLYFIKNTNYGFGPVSLKLLIKRLELNYFNFKSFNSLHQLLIWNYLNNFNINNNTYKNRTLVNIYLLNLLGTYRGWRHSRGLPVRGQRTWSNAWSSYRSNLVLRSYKIHISKKMYGGNFSKDYFTAYLAEEVNNMWRLQWGFEWLEAKRKRLKTTKNVKNGAKIDLQAMAKLNIGSFGKTSNATKQKKQKKNVFTLGFDPGFTKILLKN